jgi:hypothetical protein
MFITQKLKVQKSRRKSNPPNRELGCYWWLHHLSGGFRVSEKVSPEFFRE